MFEGKDSIKQSAHIFYLFLDYPNRMNIYIYIISIDMVYYGYYFLTNFKQTTTSALYLLPKQNRKRQTISHTLINQTKFKIL